MTEPARAESDLHIEAAREALVPRMRKGDLTAFEEFFALGGVEMRFLRNTDDTAD